MKLAHQVVLIEDEFERVLGTGIDLSFAQMLYDAAIAVFHDQRYEVEIRDLEVAEDMDELLELFKDAVLEIGDEDATEVVFGKIGDAPFEVIEGDNEEIVFNPQSGEIVSHIKDMGPVKDVTQDKLVNVLAGFTKVS